jgi:formate dehydrogenase subunit gamma
MKMRRSGLVIGLSALSFAMLIFLVSLFQTALTVERAFAESSVRPPADAVTNAPMEPGVGRVPDAIAPPDGGAVGQLDVLGPNSDATLWGEVRRGTAFTVSIPNQEAATLVQSFGVEWQHIRSSDGPLRTYGAMLVFATFALLFMFYLFRGRIKIEHGFSGQLIERFSAIERFGHWLLAGSFIVLMLTGANLLYGRDLMIPVYAVVVSPEAAKEVYAWTASVGKWLHNHVAWAFIVGLIYVFLLWVIHNLPTRDDVRWLMMAGGLFSEGVHPPARKFNAGQKMMFWAIMLVGSSVALSGVSMLFPNQLPLVSKVFAVLNGLGAEMVWGAPLPTELTPLQEMQFVLIWHVLAALALIMLIIAHIYIGTLGMEGAFSAMGTGMVDRNWAEEHHGLWVEEMDAKAAGDAAATPAE